LGSLDPRELKCLGYIIYADHIPGGDEYLDQLGTTFWKAV
jgi:hypothetical protein